MVPPSARHSDVGCILYGCSVPVLLRKPSGEDAHTLVGEYFIDQCMSGEASTSDHQKATILYRVIRMASHLDDHCTIHAASRA